MKTTSDVLNVLYKTLNVAGVTGTLDSGGRVRRLRRPLDSKKRDVVLVSLPMTGGNDEDTDLQQAAIVVNCFAPDIMGQPDETHLEATVRAVLVALLAYKAATEYLDIKIVNQMILPDADFAGVSYASIRCDVTIQYA